MSYSPSSKDSADTNDDGGIDISDAVGILNFLFLGGNEPKLPYPELGYDMTDDTLDCQEYIKK